MDAKLLTVEEIDGLADWRFHRDQPLDPDDALVEMRAGDVRSLCRMARMLAVLRDLAWVSLEAIEAAEATRG